MKLEPIASASLRSRPLPGARREFERFASSADLTASIQERTWRKLRSDLDCALRDCQWAREQLDRVRDVAGMDL